MTRLAPCMINPEAFDMDNLRGRLRADETPVQRRQRIAAPLIHQCLTQCPILDRCAADADAKRAYGVVAGVYRPWPGDSTLPQLASITAKGRVLAGVIDLISTLAPGDRLPGPQELAGVYGVARNTVSAALRTLETDGLITRPVEGGRRWIVATPPPVPVTEPSESAA